MIETLWKWLLRTNAKALFLVALLAFLGMATWRIWVEVRAVRAATAPLARSTEPADPPPDLASYRELGLARLISNQLARAHASIPVNPFRPSFEDMVSRLADPTADPDAPAVDPDAPAVDPGVAAADPDAPAADPGVAAADPDAPAADPGGEEATDRPGRPGRPAAAPRITYRGMFRRSDGTLATWIEDHAARRTRIHGINADLHGATILDADITGMKLRLPDGSEEHLRFGQTIEIPPPADP